MRRQLLLALFATTATLGGCSSIKEAIRGPEMSPMGYPGQLSPQSPQSASIAALTREPPPQAASANSLWRSGARAFFDDQRASRVGDILTVLINIDDSAKTSNATNASRTSANKFGVPNFFGLQKILPGSANAVDTSTSLAHTGTGGVTRQEQITLTIAAIVTEVLPNGNLVIQGRQEVKTNNDTRILTVGGIVRPEDITSSNTILHTQIAEARINYGGQGDIAAVQKTPGGTALLQRFIPF